MKNKLEKIFDGADELQVYGTSFLNVLEQAVAQNKITVKECRSIVDTLVDADEIREAFPEEVKTLLYACLEQDGDLKSVLAFFRYCCEIYDEQKHALIGELFAVMLRNIGEVS